MKKKAVLSLSGGMDSTSLLIHLLTKSYDEIHCISFDYNQRHSVELERAKANIEYLKKKGFNIQHHILNLSPVMGLFHSSLIKGNDPIPEGHYAEENMKSSVVPNRNAIFSSIIYGYALSIVNREDKKCKVDISLGIHSGDHTIYPDCREEFRDAIAHAFAIGNWDSEFVNYYTPYLHGNKTSILKDCLEGCKALGLDFDTVLKNTITSYNPDESGRSSGKSGSDIERIEAFINIGRKDPIEYQEPWEEVVKHAKQVLADA